MKLNLKKLLGICLLLVGALFFVYGSVKQVREENVDPEIQVIDGVPVRVESVEQEAANKGYTIGGILSVVGIIILLSPNPRALRSKKYSD